MPRPNRTLTCFSLLCGMTLMQPERLLARLMAAHALEIPNLFTDFTFKPPRGTLPIIATSSVRCRTLAGEMATLPSLTCAQDAHQLYSMKPARAGFSY